MNINIYIEDSLAKELNISSKKTGKPRNAIVREAIKEWIKHHQKKSWPETVLKFKGVPDIPSFESTRDELSPPSEDPLQ